jgi:hypothetical protein
MGIDTSPSRLANDAMASIRALAHTTHDQSAYGKPSEVSTVLDELAALVHMLPLVLAQAGAWLVTEYEVGRVGHDDPAADVRAVVQQVVFGDLDRARQQARDLADALDAATQATSHLTSPGKRAGG